MLLDIFNSSKVMLAIIYQYLHGHKIHVIRLFSVTSDGLRALVRKDGQLSLGLAPVSSRSVHYHSIPRCPVSHLLGASPEQDTCTTTRSLSLNYIGFIRRGFGRDSFISAAQLTTTTLRSLPPDQWRPSARVSRFLIG